MATSGATPTGRGTIPGRPVDPIGAGQQGGIPAEIQNMCLDYDDVRSQVTNSILGLGGAEGNQGERGVNPNGQAATGGGIAAKIATIKTRNDDALVERELKWQAKVKGNNQLAERYLDGARPAPTCRGAVSRCLGAHPPCPWREGGKAIGESGGGRSCWLFCWCCCVCVCLSLRFRTIPTLYCRGIASIPPHGAFSPYFKARQVTIMLPPSTEHTSSCIEGVCSVIGMGCGITLGLRF
jgi:hypothetical protein